MITEEGSTKIANLMTPGAGQVGHYSEYAYQYTARING